MKLLKLEKPNCNGCVEVSNFLEFKGVEYESIDVTENPEVASKYRVMSVPVTILLDDNETEVDRAFGVDKGKIEELISQL